MTYSILAAEPETGRIGAAIASRFLAVGAYCVYLGPAGGVITQGLANPLLGTGGLAALAGGEAPAAILDRLLAADPHADQRQTQLINPAGLHAARSGARCGAWAGSVAGDGVTLAGNMLVGVQVLDAMHEAWATGSGPMVERLLDALAAGEDAGGDRRGLQAAAIRVQAGEIYPEVDLRVDDRERSPVEELRRLYRRHLAADVQAFRDTLPRHTAAGTPEYPGIGDLSAVQARDPDDG